MRNTKKQAEHLHRLMREQGRSTTWLAEKTGYSRAHVSRILNGKETFSVEFQRRAALALQTSALVPVTYRGRKIDIPQNIYTKAGSLSPVVVETVYEEAWKRAWLEENAAIALAAAADRAFQTHQALSTL